MAVLPRERSDIEKASNEIFSFFEFCNASTTSIGTALKELTIAFNKNPVTKDMNSHFKNLSYVCSNTLEKQIVVVGVLE